MRPFSTLTEGDIATAIGDMVRRCEAAEAAGGISKVGVLNNVATIPPGWKRDRYVDYWLPPNVELL